MLNYSLYNKKKIINFAIWNIIDWPWRKSCRCGGSGWPSSQWMNPTWHTIFHFQNQKKFGNVLGICKFLKVIFVNTDIFVQMLVLKNSHSNKNFHILRIILQKCKINFGYLKKKFTSKNNSILLLKKLNFRVYFFLSMQNLSVHILKSSNISLFFEVFYVKGTQEWEFFASILNFVLLQLCINNKILGI